jgi:hypothetical protein
MAHYAQINSDNIVTQVVTLDNSVPNGSNFLNELFGGTWVQTSFNTRGGIHYAPNSTEPDSEPQLGYNYAGIGYNYDPITNAFYSPQPFNSWVLNTTTYYWEAPTPPGPAPQAYPPSFYEWDETTLSWVLVTV